MKLKLHLVFLLIFISLNGFNQVKPFRFGVRIAPNIAWLSPDSENYENEGAVPGFSWGFLADITLTENYFIKTGFSLDYLNAKLSYPHQQIIDDVTSAYTLGTLHRKYNLRYLEIPITLKMRTNQFGKMAFYGEIGFGTSFNLKARSQDEFFPQDGSPSDQTENDIKDEIALVKGSLIVGAGLEFFIDESTSIITSLTFNNGLTNILKGENSVDPGITQMASLSYFQLNIGIMF